MTISGFIKLYQNSTCSDDQSIELPLQIFIRIGNTEKLIYKFNYICKENTEIGSQVLENKIIETTSERMAVIILKYNDQYIKEQKICIFFIIIY